MALQYRQFHRVHEEGHAHFLTFSCRYRWPMLAQQRSRKWMLDAIVASTAKYNVACWAYVIMPEHVHLLVLPPSGMKDDEYSSWVASLKVRVSRKAVRYLKANDPVFLEKLAEHHADSTIEYHFWQPGGGMDTNLWSPRVIWDKIDYIHNNPIRRGLVVRPEDWQWSSYRDFAAAHSVGLVPLAWYDLPSDPRS